MPKQRIKLLAEFVAVHRSVEKWFSLAENTQTHQKAGAATYPNQTGKNHWFPPGTRQFQHCARMNYSERSRLHKNLPNVSSQHEGTFQMGAHEAGAGEQHNFTRGDLCLSQTSSSGRRWERLCDPTTTSEQPWISPAPEELAKPGGGCLKVWAVKRECEREELLEKELALIPLRPPSAARLQHRARMCWSTTLFPRQCKHFP